MSRISTPSISRRDFLRGAGALAAGSVLAGCAGQGGQQASDSGDLTKITFSLDYDPNTNHTGIYVAQEKGYFADEGLEVTIVPAVDGSADPAIGSGTAQLGISYQDYIANDLATDDPLPIVAVAAVIQHNTSGIMSRKEDNITRAKDMENHTYATWDMPIEQATIKRIVETDGGDFSKVQMVPYETSDEISGLKTNMFDTVWSYEGWAVQNAALQGYPVNYFSFIDMDPIFDFYTPVLAANSDFAKENPDTVKAFLRAAKKGYEYAVENPDDAADILCKQVSELADDSELVKKSANFLAGQYTADASSWGLIDKDRWARYFQWLNDNQLVEHELDVDSGWTMDYLEH